MSASQKGQLPRRDPKAPLPNTPANRRQGFQLLAELKKLVNLRVERRQIVGFESFAYCSAATLTAIAPGREELPRFHDNGTRFRRDVSFETWPMCEPVWIFAKGKHRVFASLEDVPPEIRRDADRAIAREALRKRRGFLSGDQIADILSVTKEEVLTLDLRLVNAVDWRKADRAADRKTKKEASSKTAKASRRRKNGALSRDEYEAGSISKLSPWKAMGISRATFYRLSPREKTLVLENLRKTGELRETGEAVAMSETGRAVDISAEQIIAPCLPAEPVSLTADEGIDAAGRLGAPPPAAVESATDATFAPPSSTRSSTGRPPKTRMRYVIAPRPPVVIDGFEVQVFHWIGCGAHTAAAAMQRLAESGARGARAHAGIGDALDEQHSLLVERMERYGCDDGAIWRALAAMDRRVIDLNVEARERGVPLAGLFSDVKLAA